MTTNTNSTADWVILNAGSVCVGASAFNAGTRRKSYTTKTNALRYRAIMELIT